MERHFNTEGPVVAADHYHVPPLDRINRAEVLTLIERGKYFVLHAPRQTGKTSTLLALQGRLNSGEAGDYRCVYADFQPARAFPDDVAQVIPTILGQIASRARTTLGDDFPDQAYQTVLAKRGAGGAFLGFLTAWAEADSRPLVLLLDEVDVLEGSALVSVLSQLRAGYVHRPKSFPQSVVLCGVQDVRDYRMESGGARKKMPSAFNIKAKSLRLGNFEKKEVRSLLAQHTDATGQSFEPGAEAAIWDQTQGQPWLVNALCRDVCFESEAGLDRDRAITESDILAAREELIQRRETHLDQLADRLREPRVRRVIQPLLLGATRPQWTARDVEYVRDLGLIAREQPARIANPIYREVIPRELTEHVQEALSATLDPKRFEDPTDRSLNMDLLLRDFQQFFRENVEEGVEVFHYREAWPQLLLMAFLHRVVNGEGDIGREYALGRGRADLLIRWPRARARARRTRRWIGSWWSARCFG